MIDLVNAQSVLQDYSTYRYVTKKVTGRSQIIGSTTVTFSDNAPLLLASGELSGATDLTLGATGSLGGDLTVTNGLAIPVRGFRRGDYAVQLNTPPKWSFETTGIVGTTNLSFNLAGLAEASGELVGATSITFGENADLDGTTDLTGSTSVTFATTGTIVTTTGDLSGSAGLVFSPVGIIRGTASISGSTDLTFNNVGSMRDISVVATQVYRSGLNTYQYSPVAAYFINSPYAAQFTLVGQSDISFAASGALTGVAEGAMTGIATVAFSPVTGAIRAKGALGANNEVIAFTNTGTLTNAAASPLTASTNITFSESATLTADGELAGSTSITFSEVARLTSGAISGSTSITFANVADGIRKVVGGGSTSITFATVGNGTTLGGESISGSTSITFTPTATPKFGGGLIVSFEANGVLTNKVDLRITKRGNRSNSSGRRRNTNTRRKQAA